MKTDNLQNSNISRTGKTRNCAKKFIEYTLGMFVLLHIYTSYGFLHVKMRYQWGSYLLAFAPLFLLCFEVFAASVFVLGSIVLETYRNSQPVFSHQKSNSVFKHILVTFITGVVLCAVVFKFFEGGYELGPTLMPMVALALITFGKILLLGVVDIKFWGMVYSIIAVQVALCFF